MKACWRNTVNWAVIQALTTVALAESPQRYEQVPFRVAAELRDDITLVQTNTTGPKDESSGRIFNPDPGASAEVEPTPIPEALPELAPRLPKFGEEPLPRSLRLPRKGVRETEPYRHKLEYEHYEESAVPEGSEPVPNRWFIGFG